jgi:hypothetical protein
MFTSNRIPHDSGLYHEEIYFDNEVVAKVLSEEDGTYWWIILKNCSISKGYKTVADAKKLLFISLDRIYDKELAAK